MARLLEREDFGIFALALLYIAFIDVFVDLGLVSAIIQRKEVSQRQLSSCFWLLSLVSIALLGASQLLAPAIGRFFFDEERVVPLIRALSVTFLVLPVTIICTAMLSRKFRLDSIAKLELGSALLRCMTVVGLGLAGVGVMSLVYGFMLERLLLATSLAYVARWRPMAVLRVDEIRPLVSFGANITAGRLLWLAYTRLDTLIIGRLLGAEVLGLYTIAAQISNAFLQFISTAYYRIAFPLFSQVQDSAKLVAVFLKMSLLLAIATLPVFLGMSVVAVDLVAVVLGPRWLDAVPALQVLAIVAAMQAVSGLLPQVSNAAGYPGLATRMNFATVIAFGAGFYAGAKIAGLSGVLVAWSVLFPIRYLVMAAVTGRLINMSLRSYASNHLPPLIAALAMATGVAIFGVLVSEWHPALRLIASVGLGACIFVGLSLVLYRESVAVIVRLALPGYRESKA